MADRNRRPIILVVAGLAAVTAAWFMVTRTGANQPVATVPITRAVAQSQQLASQAVLALETEAMPFDRATFGPGTKTYAFRAQWHIQGATPADDGTLYVAVTPGKSNSNIDKWYLGVLSEGRLELIPLPKTQYGWGGMTFKQPTTGASAVVDALQYMCCHRLFALRGLHAFEIKPSSRVSPAIGGTLTTGERCEQPDDVRNGVMLTAVSPSGSSRPLVNDKMLRLASRGLITDTTNLSLECAHFAGANYVSVMYSVDSVVFRLNGNALQLVTRGGIQAANDRHMLISIVEDSPQGPSGYEDYLEVIRQ